jgi:hypothetical protein
MTHKSIVVWFESLLERRRVGGPAFPAACRLGRKCFKEISDVTGKREIRLG